MKKSSGLTSKKEGIGLEGPVGGLQESTENRRDVRGAKRKQKGEGGLREEKKLALKKREGEKRRLCRDCFVEGVVFWGGGW